MRIIEKIKWGKLRRIVWDEELEQTNGIIIYNYPSKEWIWHPDRIGFSSTQLKEIKRLLDALRSDGGQKHGE